MGTSCLEKGQKRVKLHSSEIIIPSFTRKERVPRERDLHANTPSTDATRNQNSSSPIAKGAPPRLPLSSDEPRLPTTSLKNRGYLSSGNRDDHHDTMQCHSKACTMYYKAQRVSSRCLERLARGERKSIEYLEQGGSCG